MSKVSDPEDEAKMAATHWELEVDEENPEVDIAKIIASLEDVKAINPKYDTIDNLIQQLFSDPLPADAQATIQFTYQNYRIDIQQSGNATFMKSPKTSEIHHMPTHPDQQRGTILLPRTLGGLSTTAGENETSVSITCQL